MFDLKAILKDNRQPAITALLVGMLVCGGHLPPRLESLTFYGVILGVALIAYSRSTAMNLLLAASTVTFMVAWLREFHDALTNVVFCVSGLMSLSLGIASTVRFVLKAKDVSHREAFALVNCYLIVGFAWALLYSLVDGFRPGSFIFPPGEGRAMDNYLYFSFVTMTTVGFGDMVPLTILTKRLTVAQAVFGQFYFALVVAYLLNKLFNQRNKGDE